MKNIRSVFILLIGIISLTAFASTSKLDQKQKPVLEMEQPFHFDTVNVATIDFVLNEINFSIRSKANAYFIAKNESKPITHIAIITDVGWQSSNQLFNKIFYREKLQENLFTKDNPTKYCRSNC